MHMHMHMVHNASTQTPKQEIQDVMHIASESSSPPCFKSSSSRGRMELAFTAAELRRELESLMAKTRMLHGCPSWVTCRKEATA
jgi:hypothetical protein